MKFSRLTEFAKSLVPAREPEPEMPRGWDLMRTVAELYATIPTGFEYQFRMSRPTWDELCRINNLHHRSDPVFGDTIFGIPVRIWPHVPAGHVWRVSREVLKDLGEDS